MKKKGGWLIIVLIVLFSAVWMTSMYCLDLSLPKLAKIPHRISGEIWFQLISSWLLAIPSYVICAYALVQTWRYHALDEERLRPEIRMDSAELLMQMVGWEKFDQWAENNDSINERQLEEYRAYRQKHRKGDDGEYPRNLSFLCFKSRLFLRSGESVSQMSIEEIKIWIGKQGYKIKFANSPCAFRTSFKDGYEEYDIEWKLDFLELQIISDGRKAEVKPEDFWDDMYESVFDDDCNVTKQNVRWEIKMDIRCGVNETKRKKMALNACWKIWWDWVEREHINTFVTRCVSNEGLFIVG